MKAKSRQNAIILFEMLITMSLITGLIVAINRVHMMHVRLEIAAKKNLLEAEENEEVLWNTAADFD